MIGHCAYNRQNNLTHAFLFCGRIAPWDCERWYAQVGGGGRRRTSLTEGCRDELIHSRLLTLTRRRALLMEINCTGGWDYYISTHNPQTWRLMWMVRRWLHGWGDVVADLVDITAGAVRLCDLQEKKPINSTLVRPCLAFRGPCISDH